MGAGVKGGMRAKAKCAQSAPADAESFARGKALSPFARQRLFVTKAVQPSYETRKRAWGTRGSASLQPHEEYKMRPTQIYLSASCLLVSSIPLLLSVSTARNSVKSRAQISHPYSVKRSFCSPPSPNKMPSIPQRCANSMSTAESPTYTIASKSSAPLPMRTKISSKQQGSGLSRTRSSAPTTARKYSPHPKCAISARKASPPLLLTIPTTHCSRCNDSQRNKASASEKGRNASKCRDKK